MVRALLSRAVTACAAAAAVLGTGACAGVRSEPDGVDTARLAALEDAAPFDADWQADPARGAFRSAAVLAYRGHVSFTEERTAPPDGRADQAVWTEGVTTAAALRTEGWTVVGATCQVAGDAVDTVVVVATRDVADVVAVARVTVDTDARRGTLVVPYHTEEPDPWGLDPLDGPTCVDGDTPPSVTVTAGADPEDVTDVPLA